MYPLVRELAAAGARTGAGRGDVSGSEDRSSALLPLARRPVTDADWVEAQRANALFDAHREDLEFGYRLLADEAREHGQAMADRTAWRICSANGWWSVFGKPKAYAKARKAGAPAHDDLVARDFTADGTEPAVADRHHRAPDRLDSSSRRNTWWRCWRWRVRSTRRRRRRCSSG